MDALALPSGRARLLGVDDAPELQALLVRCADYFKAADGRAPSRHAALERIADALGDPQLRLFGLWRGQAIAGLLELRLDEPSPGESTIVLFLVEPASRRRGFGREVVEAACAALGGEGVSALHLGVQDHERGAHAFWSALGFVPHSDEPGVTNYVRTLGP